MNDFLIVASYTSVGLYIPWYVLSRLSCVVLPTIVLYFSEYNHDLHWKEILIQAACHLIPVIGEIICVFQILKTHCQEKEDA